MIPRIKGSNKNINLNLVPDKTAIVPPKIKVVNFNSLFPFAPELNRNIANDEATIEKIGKYFKKPSSISTTCVLKSKSPKIAD